MWSFIRTFPTNVNRTGLSILVFIVVWFVGTAALTGGFTELGEDGLLACVFGAACAAWWGARKFGGANSAPVNATGFVVIGLWTMKLLHALLFNFHYWVTRFFFWASAAILLLLVTAVALSKGLSDRNVAR